MNKQKFIRRKRNFTIIEILFVVTILIILIGIGIVAGGKILRASADTQINAEIKMIQTAIDIYKTDHKVFPDQDNIVNEIMKLRAVPNNGTQFIDPYEEEYKYLMDNGLMKVYSNSQD